MPGCSLCCGGDVELEASVVSRDYWHCRRCHLVFLSPEHRLKADDERARYLQHNNDPADPRYREFLCRLTMHMIPRLSPGAEGLDYGAGPGPALSVMMGEQGFRVSNYDPFFHPDQRLLERNYDFITCTEAVEHFYNPWQEFTRLDSLLKPGGWLGIMTEMVLPEQDFQAWWYHRDPTHVCFYRQETMIWLAEELGWSVEFPRKNVSLFRKAER